MRSIVSAVRRALACGLLALALITVLGGAAGAAPTAEVAVDVVNVRAGPSTSTTIVGRLAPGESFTVVDAVGGEEVLPGNVMWFQTAGGGFVYSGFVSPTGSGATVATSGLTGRWIEVDRRAQVARAIQNGQVVHTAPVTVGVPAFPTPVGRFTILRRVFNETMDSSTIGIPVNSPGGYFLTNVLFTQYITNDGVALHTNYWSP
ncbi:MAG: L,D-transpeptidase family protein, partial [Chloroflexi bacterium]|nr:L,D-transpeptidase family protein [Chloroflexota bacterium]